MATKFMNAIFHHCSEVDPEITLELSEKLTITSIKGVEFSYLKKVIYCPSCNEEFETPELLDLNNNVRKAAYLEAKSSKVEVTKDDLIQLIENINDKYDIGKKPLSKLLGWSEATIMRYTSKSNQSLPLNDYLTTLKNIYRNPSEFESLYLDNKDQLTSAAQIKVERALKSLLTTHTESKTDSKINIVAKYIINKSLDITPMALQKLLYYSQSFNYIFNKRFLFDNDCEAWVYGPVYPEIYQKYKDYKHGPIGSDTLSETNFEELGFSEKEVLDYVIKAFGCYSGSILANMSHIEKPWINARGNLKDHEPSNIIISKEDLEIYFINVKNKYNMINPSDLFDYADELFKRVH